MLFVLAQLLFPHYQALGKTQPNFTNSRLMVWVIAQNAGTGLFSLISGVLADRFGNRLLLRIQIFIAALTPPLAVWLAGQGIDNGTHLFWLAFFTLGMTPVVFRTLINFTLELSEPNQHARYLSTLKVTMAVPFLISPLVGLLVDWLGFQRVFLFMAVLIAIGGLQTFRLIEPRHRL
jgi:MFS family permease